MIIKDGRNIFSGFSTSATCRIMTLISLISLIQNDHGHIQSDTPTHIHIHAYTHTWRV